MARLKASVDLLVDRHYRGAQVMVGARSFALPEAAIAFVEKIQRSIGGYTPRNEEEQLLAAALMSRGILQGDSK